MKDQVFFSLKNNKKNIQDCRLLQSLWDNAHLPCVLFYSTQCSSLKTMTRNTAL